MEEQRRSSRITSILPVHLSGIDFEGKGFRENTWTVSLNKHGAKISTARKMAKGDPLTILFGPSQEPVESRVVWVQQMGQGYAMGIELMNPRNIWGLENPPEDWRRKTALATAGFESEAAQQVDASARECFPAGNAASAEATGAPPPAELAGSGDAPQTSLSEQRAELGLLFEKIRQALTLTSESLKSYEGLQAESGRLIAGARDRIQNQVSKELQLMTEHAAEAVSVQAREILEKAAEGLSSMQREHQASAEGSLVQFREGLEAAVRANLATTGKQMEELVRAAAESAARCTEPLIQTFRETTDKLQGEFDDHISRSLESFRQTIQKEVAQALVFFAESKSSLLADFHKHLLSAADAMNPTKAAQAH